MIIKSMTRKQATFSQLVDYFDAGKKQDNSFTIYHNLYSKKSEFVKDEFIKNADSVKDRKNGIFMYHEILSISKSSKISLEKQKQILFEITQHYLEKRAKNNLVYGVLHDDKTDNLHYHLMISSNEAGQKTKHRLSKNEFDSIKKNLEKQVLIFYPELEQKEVINKAKDEKTSIKEFELKKRSGKQSDRDRIKTKLAEVFEKSRNKQDFFDKLADVGFELYIHGNTIGVKSLETGLKYRLKSLGLLEKFNEISPLIQQIEDIKEEIKQNRKNEFLKEKIDVRGYRKSKQEEVKKEQVKTQPEVEKSTSTRDFEQSNFTAEELEILRRKEEVRRSRENSKGDDFDLSLTI